MANLSWRLVLAMTLINLGGLFQFGYILSIYNQPSEVIIHFINFTQSYQISDQRMACIWSTSMSMLNAGMILGTVIGYILCQRVGRKPCVLFSSVVACMGVVIQSMSKSSGIFQLIGLGRFVSGVSIGLGCVAVPLYSTEASPKIYRGAMGCMCSTSYALGNFIANLIALPNGLGNAGTWHYMPLIILIFVLPILVVFANFPETPTYLMSTGAGLGKVGASLQFYHGRMTPFEYSKTLSELETECREGQAVPLRSMLAQNHYRKAIMVTVAMACANAFHGTAAIYAYMGYIVRWTGVTDLTLISIVSLLFPATDVLFSIPSFFLMEKVGRRPLVIMGNWTLTICLFVISVCLIIPQETASRSPIYFYVFLAALLTDIASISIGVGKINWFMNTELFPVQNRPVFAMVNSATQNILNMIMSAAFLPLSQSVGAFTVLILFAIPMLVFTVFLTIYVPETKKLTVVEILDTLKRSVLEKAAKIRRSRDTDSGSEFGDDEGVEEDETYLGASKYGATGGR